MKCSVCRREIHFPAVTLIVYAMDGNARTINLHRGCVRDTLGHLALRKIEAVVASGGWYQASLPHVVD